ncbi:hypothetical protein [Methanosarcina sp. MSH10X1]|nr:hypothetical protein [Methanosarcina sp. MSH10X1]
MAPGEAAKRKAEWVAKMKKEEREVEVRTRIVNPGRILQSSNISG